MARRRPRDGSFPCPHCGATCRRGASFCRECGANDESGWGDDEAVDLPSGYGGEEEFDYDEYVRREFPGEGPHRPATSRGVVWVAVVAATIAALVASIAYWQ